MTQSKGRKIANPFSFYKHPAELAKDKQLSMNDKIKALKNWLDDINQLQIAEEENMRVYWPNKHSYPVREIENLLREYQEHQHKSIRCQP